MRSLYRRLFITNLFNQSMKKIISSLVVIVCLISTAQAQFMYDINGRVVSEMSYTDVEGTPYFTEGWNTGLVNPVKGNPVDGVKMRYDAYKDELEYEKDGKLYRLGPEIKEFSFMTADEKYIFRNGFPLVDNQIPASFYRVLHDGTTKLLKRYEMKMREERQYNSATTTKRFFMAEELFVLKDGTMTALKKNDKKTLLSLLADEKKLMEFAIKEQELNFKNDLDVVKLLEEYDAYKAGRKSNN